MPKKRHKKQFRTLESYTYSPYLYEKTNPIEPPTSPVGTAVVATSALVAGTVVGATAVYVYVRNEPSVWRGLAMIGGGVMGWIATGAAGLLVAAFSEKWRKTALTTAGLGFGVPLAIALLGGVRHPVTATPAPQA